MTGIKLTWSLLVALVAGFIAYQGSRSADGHLFWSCYAFVYLAIGYGLGRRYILHDRVVRTVVVDFVLAEIAVLIGLAVVPQLDEMGGMLNIFIPLLAAGAIFVGHLVWLALRNTIATEQP